MAISLLWYYTVAMDQPESCLLQLFVAFRTLPLSLPFLRKCLIPPGSKQTWGALTTLNSRFMDTSGRYSCLSYKSGLQRGPGMVLPRLCLAALKPRPFLWASLRSRGILDSSGCCRQKEPTSLTH